MNRERNLLLTLGLLAATACASSSSSSSAPMGAAPEMAANMSTTAPTPDPRVGLRGGAYDDATKSITTRAGEASWNIQLISNTPSSQKFIGVTNSDLAFVGSYVVQGNYSGYQVWDISNPRNVALKTAYLCPASQSDVSVYKNLLFVSAEAPTARLDCGAGGVADTVSKERIRGIRIFDATDISNPKYIANVQTCRGSHTHTVVDDPKDPNNIYVYISGSSGVRSSSELAGCSAALPNDDPNSELFKIEVIQIPLAHPEQAHVVSKPAILANLAAVTRHAETAEDQALAAARAAARAGGAGGRGGRAGGAGRANLPPMGPQQCHDITVYPAIGLAGGACGGYGVLLDISDVGHPKRITAAADSNFSFWHSATFNNDGTKMLFSDEWGGGSQPRCRVTDKMEWGADAIFTLTDRKMDFKGYYKMPAAQTSFENCVAHNGSLIPIPGRDIMIQGWYQGGISLFDWTDPSHVKEIGYFDRGPLDANRFVDGGSWSAYWYNGMIYSSEIKRGLDIFELVPSAFLSKNELDAAKTVHFAWENVQDQQKLVWPPSYPLSRSYLDQLERTHGQSAEKIASARAALAAAEKAGSPQARKDALNALATKLHADAGSATDAPKAHKLAYSVADLANAQV